MLSPQWPARENASYYLVFIFLPQIFLSARFSSSLHPSGTEITCQSLPVTAFLLQKDLRQKDGGRSAMSQSKFPTTLRSQLSD